MHACNRSVRLTAGMHATALSGGGGDVHACSYPVSVMAGMHVTALSGGEGWHAEM